MTPKQRAALEGVVDRPLTDEEVERIGPLLDYDNRNDVEIVSILSEGRTRPRSYKIGIDTVLGRLAPGGGAFLTGLQGLGATDPNVYWALKLIEAGNLDVGHQATIDLATELAKEHPQVADGIALLLQLGVEPARIDLKTLSNALNAAEGRASL